MQIYISADIEGTCGIADWSETERKTMDDYRPFQQQMTREVAAACAGAVAAGAEDILLKDAHDTARNLLQLRLRLVPQDTQGHRVDLFLAGIKKLREPLLVLFSLGISRA